MKRSWMGILDYWGQNRTTYIEVFDVDARPGWPGVTGGLGDRVPPSARCAGLQVIHRKYLRRHFFHSGDESNVIQIRFAPIKSSGSPSARPICSSNPSMCSGTDLMSLARLAFSRHFF